MRTKEIVKLLFPPLLQNCCRSLLNRRIMPNSNGEIQYGLLGDYRSWADAMAASAGYDNAIILEKTKAALLKVKNGEAVYERDSVLFDEIQYAWSLLAGLMWVAAQSGGRLNVLDFGGSLGSTYFQNRAFVRHLPEVKWNIVEQSQHVEVGKAWFEDEHLKFYTRVEDCLAETQPNVVLLSGVLQYLEQPFEILSKLLRQSCNRLIIDRTPFWEGPTDRLCVQHVPPEIYPASYPCWIFSTKKILPHLGDEWKIIADFDGFDKLKAPIKAIWRGMILERKKV